MPEYITPAFSANPEGFMEKNIVIQKVPDATPAGQLDVVIIVAKGYGVINRKGGLVCMMAKKPSSVEESMNIYWCPYTQNQLKSVMLGNDALYAFTPTMDGCSAALGSHGGNGVQMMSHANSGGIGGKLEKSLGIDVARQYQQAAQHIDLEKHLGTVTQIINPSDYRADGHGDHTMSSTTFAYHAMGKAWSLHTQTYRKVGTKTFFHGGVDS